MAATLASMDESETVGGAGHAENLDDSLTNIDTWLPSLNLPFKLRLHLSTPAKPARSLAAERTRSADPDDQQRQRNATPGTSPSVAPLQAKKRSPKVWLQCIEPFNCQLVNLRSLLLMCKHKMKACKIRSKFAARDSSVHWMASKHSSRATTTR